MIGILAANPEVLLETNGHRKSAAKSTEVNGANLVDSVVTNANLAATGDHHGIGQFVNNNPSQRGVVSAVTMATTVEAIIGAVFLDSDFDTVKEVMQTLGLH